MEEWKAMVPDTMKPALEMLRGEVLLDSGDGGITGGLSAFSARHLPHDAEVRFAALFSQKPLWELPEMEPYLKGLAGPGETMEALLLKFARASQQKPTHPVTYSARL